MRTQRSHTCDTCCGVCHTLGLTAFATELVTYKEPGVDGWHICAMGECSADLRALSHFFGLLLLTAAHDRMRGDLAATMTHDHVLELQL